jgi:hypothetical protein
MAVGLEWGGRFGRGDGGVACGECAGALCAPVKERKRRGRGRGAGMAVRRGRLCGDGGAGMAVWRGRLCGDGGAGGRGRPRQVGPTCR